MGNIYILGLECFATNPLKKYEPRKNLNDFSKRKPQIALTNLEKQHLEAAELLAMEDNFGAMLKFENILETYPQDIYMPFIWLVTWLWQLDNAKDYETPLPLWSRLTNMEVHFMETSMVSCALGKQKMVSLKLQRLMDNLHWTNSPLVSGLIMLLPTPLKVQGDQFKVLCSLKTLNQIGLEENSIHIISGGIKLCFIFKWENMNQHWHCMMMLLDP
jgi:hypothetical protein